jgi:hypothetical protein
MTMRMTPMVPPIATATIPRVERCRCGFEAAAVVILELADDRVAILRNKQLVRVELAGRRRYVPAPWRLLLRKQAQKMR